MGWWWKPCPENRVDEGLCAAMQLDLLWIPDRRSAWAQRWADGDDLWWNTADFDDANISWVCFELLEDSRNPSTRKAELSGNLWGLAFCKIIEPILILDQYIQHHSRRARRGVGHRRQRSARIVLGPGSWGAPRAGLALESTWGRQDCHWAEGLEHSGHW